MSEKYSEKMSEVIYKWYLAPKIWTPIIIVVLFIVALFYAMNQVEKVDGVNVLKSEDFENYVADTVTSNLDTEVFELYFSANDKSVMNFYFIQDFSDEEKQNYINNMNKEIWDLIHSKSFVSTSLLPDIMYFKIHYFNKEHLTSNNGKRSNKNEDMYDFIMYDYSYSNKEWSEEKKK